MARILVIEDDPHHLRQVVDVLSLSGHEVTTARDGLDGLSRLERLTPDLVLSDLMLPELDGMRLLSKARSARWGRNLPWVLMSAVYRQPERFADELKRYRVRAFLPKPFSLLDLSDQVELWLGSEGPVEARGLEPGWYPRAAFAGLIARLYRSRWCGRMEVGGTHSSAIWYWLNGHPVWAESDRLDELLSQGLLLRGLAPEALERARAMARRGGVRLTRSLLRSRDTEPAEVLGVLRLALGQLLGATLDVSRVQVRLERGERHASDVPVMEVHPLLGLWQGTGDRNTATVLAQEGMRLRQLSATPELAEVAAICSLAQDFPGVLARFEAAGSEDAVDVWQLLAAFPGREEELGRVLWFLCHLGGVVEPGPAAGRPLPARPEPAAQVTPVQTTPPSETGAQAHSLADALQLLEQGDPEAARVALTRLEAEQPGNPRLLSALGYAIYRSRSDGARLGVAMHYLQRALLVDPRLVQAYRYMARIYQERGEPRAFREALMGLLAVAPGDRWARAELDALGRQ